MTDEQMFKMDKMIAAVLRTQKDARDSGKRIQQVSQQLSLNLKFENLQLYAHTSKNPYLLQLYMSLL